MATAYKRDFTAVDAAEERANTTRPLLIGLTGPSGSGKTYSALRLAGGIQSVVGGDIYVVDTEQRRSLDYAGDFSFKHVDFRAPFGSLDYLEALRFCKRSGAGVVVIDSCSHEHDGPGGLLEQHETELDRIAGDDWKKRDRVAMLAWQKPKAGRRKLISAITTELNMPTIFCFRARKSTKPVKNPQTGKQEPLDMGFCSIGADEWLFELSLNAVFMPGSDGVPIWDSDYPGERLAIKLPKQFRALADGQHQFTEKVGRKLALWAAPGGNKAPIEAEPRTVPNDGTLSRDNPAAQEGAGDDDRGEQMFDQPNKQQRALANTMLAGIRAAKGDVNVIGEIMEAQSSAMSDWPRELKLEVYDARDIALGRGKANG